MVTLESRELSAFLLYRNYLVKKYKIKENIKNEKALPEMTEKTGTAEVTHGGSEPDISLVFRDDEDKRYDIDDILADIEKRHH